MIVDPNSPHTAPPLCLQDDRAIKRKRHDDGWDSEDSDFEDLKVRVCLGSVSLLRQCIGC